MKKLTALTLIELIIALSIASIFALVSYGTLTSTKTAYRRKEAQSELIKLKAIIQEEAVKYNCSAVDIARWIQTKITPVATVCAGLPAAPIDPMFTPNKYYQLTVVLQPDGSVILTATPPATSPQFKDSACRTITINSSFGLADDTFSSTGTLYSDPLCWQ